MADAYRCDMDGEFQDGYPAGEITDRRINGLSFKLCPKHTDEVMQRYFADKLPEKKKEEVKGEAVEEPKVG